MTYTDVLEEEEAACILKGNEAVSCCRLSPPLSAEARMWPQENPHGICGQSCIGKGLSLSISV